MRRGELWTVAGDVHASKPRPALILQEDRFDATDSVTVVPLTTTARSAPLLRPALPAGGTSGLSQDSYLMIDKITTVRRLHLGHRVGTLDARRLLEVERAVMVFLGMAG